MNRKVAAASLALIGLVFTALVLLFVFRQPVAIFAINRALAGTAVALDQLQDLALTWNNAQVKTLALRIEGFQQPIRISNIDVRFAPLDAQLEVVTIDHLSIPAYLGTEPSGPRETPLPRLSDLIRMLQNPPLQTLRIGSVTWDEQQAAEQLQWQRQGGKQTLAFRYRDFSAALNLETLPLETMPLKTMPLKTKAEPGAAGLEGQLQLRKGTTDLLASRLKIKSEDQAVYRGLITLEMQQEDWAETLATLEQYLPDLTPVTAARGKLAVSIQADIPDDLNAALRQGLEVSITPEADIALVYKDTKLPLSPLETRVRLDQPLSLNARGEDQLDIHLHIPALQMSVAAPEDGVASELQLQDIRCHHRLSIDCKMAIDLSFNTEALAMDGLQVQSLAGNVRGAVTAAGQNIKVNLEPGQLLRAEKLRQEEVAVGALTLSTSAPLQVSVEDMITGAVTLTTDRLTAEVSEAALAGGILNTELVFTDLRLTQADQLTVETGVSALPISFDIPKQSLPRFGFRGDLTLGDNNLSITGSLDSDASRPLITLTASYNAVEQTGNANLRSAPLSFDQGANKLSRHFATWPLQLDIVNGRWDMQSQLSWRQTDGGLRLKGEFKQTLEQWAGYYKDYAFTGLNSTLDTRVKAADSLVSARPARVDIGTLDIGVPVTDISARFSFDTGAPRLDLHQLQADLLGGRVSAADIVHRPGVADTDATVTIDNIDLGELVRLTATQDISATGRVSGQLPFVIGATGPSMEQGRLGALQPGGMLAYHPDPATLQAIAENPTTKFAYDVLSNYHYSTLDAEIRYQPDGWMVLTNRMYGVNPDLNNGQPIKLNPKIEVNALDTLRSLRVSRTVSDFFEGQLGNP